MAEHITKTLSLVLRLLGLVFFVPAVLAGCGSSGAGGSLGSNASFGLGNEGAAYVPSKSIAYRSTATRAKPVVRQAKKKLVKKIIVRKKVKTAKLQKRLPVHVGEVARKSVSSGKIESRMATKATSRSARPKPLAVKTTKPVVVRKIVWKKKEASHASANTGQPAKKTATKKSTTKKPVQMVPEKAISPQLALAAMEKSLNDLSKEAARDENRTQKEPIKRTAKVEQAPVTFGFGQTAHRFSGQQ